MHHVPRAVASGQWLGKAEVKWVERRMGGLVQSLKYNLARLFDFSGRETRSLFWPYALFLLLGSGVIGMILVIPMILESMSRMQRFALEHPDQATVTSGPGTYSFEIKGHHPELMPDVNSFLLIAVVVNGVILVMLAAAITRRLHDIDYRGWWALLPLPFAASGIFLMRRLLGMAADSAAPDPRVFVAAFVNNFIYLAVAGLLILLLARPGTDGPNRFGSERN